LVEFSNQFVACISHRLKKTPIIAMQPQNGHIKIVRHEGCHLITPLVQDILTTGLSGTTCVLTKKNEEALQITALLLKNDVHAKLIQSNDGFSLFNLDEVRYFLLQLKVYPDVYTINDDDWLNAKREVVKRYKRSTRLEVLEKIIKDFESTHPKMKYFSDLETFIRESKLEDFIIGNGETILVSTIHKAKGKEFDNLFLMLDSFNLATDADKRLLYVALTRAKTTLTIHLNSSFLNNFSTDGLYRYENKEKHSPPSQLAMHLSFKHVWLNYFRSRRHLIAKLTSGENLIVNGNECLDSDRKPVLKFSKEFVQQVENLKTKNYRLKTAKVNFIVYWKKEGTEEEIKIILPELVFERE